MNTASSNSNVISLVIKKAERSLTVLSGNEVIEVIDISLGFDPDGDKLAEGDGKTPEGEFYIFTKNDKSRYFLSLGLSYPNVEAADRGLKEGVISVQEYSEIINALSKGEMPLQKTALGGEIYIHGGGCAEDWTRGCIALENDRMQELFDLFLKERRF